MLLAEVLAPAPANASRMLAWATAPDLESLSALELAGVAQAEPLPLHPFVDVVVQ